MGWSIHQKLSKHDKLLRKFVTVKYAKLTFASVAVFIAVLLLLNILLPRVHRLRRGWPYYSSKEPSRAFVLPLRFIVVFWAVALPYFLFAETRQDYLALVKRLGSVSVSMLPIVHFLALRPSPLPRMFYLQLLPLHKWLSRIFILTVIAHAILYFAIYVHLGKVRKLLITSNLCGLIACTLFIAIILTSLKPIRRRFYNLFYSVHYFTAWVSLPLIYYHARITHVYVIIAACLLAAQACYRAFTSRHIKLPVQYISPSMFFISIPREQLPRTLQKYYSPGSHVRVSNPLYHFSTWLQSSHPYTIASLPQDPQLTLVIRKTTYPIKLRRFYALTGPYSSLPVPFFEDATRGLVKRVLFVAGGTGIAFVAPIMRHLRSLGVPVRLLWAIRDANDAKVLETLGLTDCALKEKQIEIYVTGDQTARPSAKWYMPSGAEGDESLNIDVDDDCCGGGEFKPLLSKYSYHKTYTDSPDFSTIMFNSRPVLNLRIKSWLHGVPIDTNTCCCLDQLMEMGTDLDPAGRWILASGAETLVGETEKWASSNKFSFYKDEFSM
ncbi:hypothetical protein DV453_004363 [Geotrichum candidum]|nr:hypothetical protein DV453_004363 [Geotrichum candidum]